MRIPAIETSNLALNGFEAALAVTVPPRTRYQVGSDTAALSPATLLHGYRVPACHSIGESRRDTGATEAPNLLTLNFVLVPCVFFTLGERLIKIDFPRHPAPP